MSCSTSSFSFSRTLFSRLSNSTSLCCSYSWFFSCSFSSPRITALSFKRFCCTCSLKMLWNDTLLCYCSLLNICSYSLFASLMNIYSSSLFFSLALCYSSLLSSSLFSSSLFYSSLLSYSLLSSSLLSSSLLSSSLLSSSLIIISSYSNLASSISSNLRYSSHFL